MKKIFKYTEHAIEVDISQAMKHGKENSPDMAKHYFKTKEEAMEDGKKLGLAGVHTHTDKNGKVMYMAGKDHASFMKKHKEMMDKKARAAMHKEDEKTKAAMHKDEKMKAGMHKDEKTKAGMHDKKKMDAAHHGKDKDKMKAAYHKDKDTKAAYHKGDKKVKAEMSEKQKSALDQNKDGKISKEDFELLRKKKKKSDAGYGGGDMKKKEESKSMHKDKDGKKVKPKMTYAQMLSDIAAKKYSDGV